MARQRSKQKQIQGIAQKTFGYDSLRSGQQQVIEAVVDGHDTLAVMPTGSGKSAIYFEEVLQVAEAVQKADAPLEPEDLQEETELSQKKLTKALSRLEEVEAVEILPTGEVIKSETEVNQESAASSAALAEERREQFVRRRVPCACPLGTQRLVARHRAWK